jgi:hypothetical protein
MAAPKPINMSSTQAQNTLSPELRNDIYSALLSGTGIRNIESTLDHEMQASGFKFNLKGYIMHLLRSGQCTTFDEIMVRVNDKIRHDTDAAKSNGTTTNGVHGTNGHSKDGEDYDLCLPEKMITEGIRTVGKELDKVCDITDIDK